MAGQLSGGVRAVATGLVRHLPADPTVGRASVETVRQVLLSGASVTAPFVVTLLVLGVVVDFVSGLLAPFARALALLGLTGGQEGLLAQGLVLAVLFGVVLLVGVVVESGPTTGVERGFGRVVEAVPGVGSVYSSFDRMSDVMLESDVGGFQEVKLVEFPHADVYSLAFQTSEIRAAGPSAGGTDAGGSRPEVGAGGVEGSGPDGAAGEAVDGEEMLVLFVPLAPNPVMGGFMVCVPDHRVREVDMTVQEAFQAIITSGVAWADSSHA